MDRSGWLGLDVAHERPAGQTVEQLWQAESPGADARDLADGQLDAASKVWSLNVSFGLAFKEAELTLLRRRLVRQQRSLLGFSASGGPASPCRWKRPKQRPHVPLERWTQRSVVEGGGWMVERKQGRPKGQILSVGEWATVGRGDLRRGRKRA